MQQHPSTAPPPGHHDEGRGAIIDLQIKSSPADDPVIPIPSREGHGAGFILDSGAAVHATSCAALLSGERPPPAAGDGGAGARSRFFRTRVGAGRAVASVGSIDNSRFAVPDVHLVPGLLGLGGAATTIISVRQLARRGLAVTFGGDYCSVKERSTGAVVGEGRLREDDGFYYLDYLRVPHS